MTWYIDSRLYRREGSWGSNTTTPPHPERRRFPASKINELLRGSLICLLHFRTEELSPLLLLLRVVCEQAEWPRFVYPVDENARLSNDKFSELDKGKKRCQNSRFFVLQLLYGTRVVRGEKIKLFRIRVSEQYVDVHRRFRPREEISPEVASFLFMVGG